MNVDEPRPDGTRRSLTASALLLLTGCATTVQAPAPGPDRLAAPVVATTQVGLLVTGTPAMRAAPGWPAFRAEWRDAFKTASAAAGLRMAYFDTFPTEHLPGTVLVRIAVNDYRHVDSGMRWALGVITGNAFVDADVEFIELPSRRILGGRRYSTSSSHWQGVLSAMTHKQLAALAYAMVQELRAP